MWQTLCIVSVLIVEDERAVATILEQALQEAGYPTQVAATLAEARAVLATKPVDLVVLDIMLPDGDGITFLDEIRDGAKYPVLILTARDGWQDRVRGLDAGADDYLGKPFRLEEFLARVRALLRRHRGDSGRVTVKGLTIDLFAHRVTMDGKLIFLSNTEYGLLELLAKNLGEVVSKATILEYVWDDASRDTNLVEVYINYVRHKLERNGAARLIHTVRGKGYILSETPPD